MSNQHKNNSGWGIGAFLVALSIVLAPTLGHSQDRNARPVSQGKLDTIAGQKLAAPITVQGTHPRLGRILDLSSVGASGKQQVIVRLRTPAVASMKGAQPGEMLGRKVNIEDEQAGFLARC